MDKTNYLKEIEILLKNNDESNENISNVLKYAANLLNLDMPVIFDKSHLATLLGLSVSDFNHYVIGSNDSQYNTLMIPKKSGSFREISIPSVELKKMQRWILDNILYKIEVSEYATGFVRKKSIKDNAKCHLENNCVINLDLKNFFPTIHFDRVFKIFYYSGYTKEVSFLLSKICTYKSILPQGSPASPQISNIACLKLDYRLSKLSKCFRASFSRYADDLTFSGDYGITKIIDTVKKIVNDEGFEVNEKKIRIQFKHQKQNVTGLTVNDFKVRVSREYLRKFRQEIYFCQKFGIRDHLRFINSDRRYFRDYMYGKAYFINMIDVDEGKLLLNKLNQINWEV
ncbi:MAG: reverse transcriptase family protein [Erysipelothrix sp.]|nr:reverse transcriptase family protein [Erysipelothrix sp.]